MDKLRIRGGKSLSGRVEVAGAKNAALPAIAACLLTGDRVRLDNLPRVRDVRTMLRVLEHLGARVSGEIGGRAEVSVERFASHEAPYDLVKTMRASVLVLGPLVARLGKARVSMPGGCAIGERPINLHLDGLARMGADIRLEHGYVEASAGKLRGAEIAFPFKTVTGTENLMMAATLAEGTTTLVNCAREPEVEDLARLLGSMGASIQGAGTDTIVVEGRERLGGGAHAVIPDRIEAGTYAIAAAMAAGAGHAVEIARCEPHHLDAVLRKLTEAGVAIESGADRIVVRGGVRLAARDLQTDPYPGFPTDMQAQYMALMTRATGVSVIAETIFERRFMHVGELQRMGADIRIRGRSAVVVGPAALTGAQVMATDLRASASLILAALVADGVTVVDRVYHLDRGYEAMEGKLRALGADVERIR